jgi:two-component system, NarL family, sensor histidine kinase UhpB
MLIYGQFPAASGIQTNTNERERIRGEAMHEPPPESRLSLAAAESPWRDLVLVAGITVMAFVLSSHFQFNEALFSLTRHWEYFQVDELPVGMFVLSLCLIWLARKRYAHARRELHARRIAEARLAEALQENRRLAQENLRIQEVERKHLARELHDELGQYLNAIKLDAVSIGDSGGTDAQFSTDASIAIIRNVDHIHRAVSEMIGRLRPVGLDELGLVAAIEHCVDQWCQRIPNTQILFSVEGNFEGLAEPLTLTLFRLIQEGLTNIFKHANAGHAEISLRRDNGADVVRLRVADDGCGMEAGARRTRFGMSGMRERVEMSGGTFVLTSEPGRGLEFEAWLPATGANP